MIYKTLSALVLLVSVLAHCHCELHLLFYRLEPFRLLTLCADVSGAVVSLLVPFADPDNAITANFLGTDAEGHTSWSLGVGTTSGSFTNTNFLGGTFNLYASSRNLLG